MSSFALVLLLFTALLLLSGCYSVSTKLDNDRTADRRLAYSAASRPFAMMCALVYEPDPAPEKLKAESKAKRAHDLRAVFEGELSHSGWVRRQPPLGRQLPSARATAAGMAYDIWINAELKPKVVAIAFRGTEAGDWRDWWSNLWWLTRFLPGDNQYAACEHEFDGVFAEFADELKAGETVFITTGHSLGGGLAQCLRYLWPLDVRQCYAFDPSPATARSARSETSKRDFDCLPPVDGFPGALTMRLYEKGEILAYVRAQLRIFYPISGQINEVRFDFRSGINPFSQHNMALLAQSIDASAKEIPSKVRHPDHLPAPWWDRRRTIEKAAINPTSAR